MVIPKFDVIPALICIYLWIVSCMVATNIEVEKRKQIIFGVTVFLLFHVFNYPWPFYPGPLDYVPEGIGMMQGIHSFGGSISQFVAPILTTYLFKVSGYKYIMVTQICTLGLALLLTVVFYKRLVPLKMKPALGKAAKYKNGVFYTM
ncbi:hypothetical protein ANCCAN_18295 [Ancylostoma caninum]|uniref:Major facilitator superfamily (MFS) profile domain-containing protein n=1 Tax=Ancylostoma caninum TaxID=29170 RepID=A0A368FUF9_ANCCA|nr:hypothetical protein ANCCAN_18295 [Ancylostoma caninum]